MTDTPRRGRPKGATRYAKIDQDILAKVADLVTDSKPSLTPTAAMRKLGHHDASVHRRLQRKWNGAAADLQEKVRERRRVASLPPASGQGGSSYGYSGFGSLVAAHGLGPMSLVQAEMDRLQRMRDMIDPPYVRHMRENLEREQRMRDMIDPPAGRMIREMMERERRFQDLINPPFLRTLGLTR